ncbi:MAG: NAD(P)-dependent dehydrogenase (short-subunit alcohol dehydrogenase family) [Spirosomataceae bacterium]|jgi:NAD(P)-dependent dehydrogenase (short-subunit alcohol dehydrogenase family)
MNELFSIKDGVFALSGGTGALGGSISEYLVRNGATVLLIGRSDEKLADKKASCDAIVKGKTATYKTDVLNETELRELKNTIKKDFGKLDGLINLAGGNLPGATQKSEQTIHDLEIEAICKVVDLNLFGTVLPSIILSELMVERGSGSIVNISSMAAKQSISRVLGYSMAKAAVDVFTKWLANELASSYSNKIRVNAIAPGFFIGNQNRKLLTNEDGSYTNRGDKIIANTPMKRFGDTSELNGAVHYLLSEASSFVTGSIYDVDGGFSTFSGV